MLAMGPDGRTLQEVEKEINIWTHTHVLYYFSKGTSEGRMPRYKLTYLPYVRYKEAQ